MLFDTKFERNILNGKKFFQYLYRIFRVFIVAQKG